MKNLSYFITLFNIFFLSFMVSTIMAQGEPGDPGAGPDFPAMRALSLRNKLVIPPSPEAASLGKYGEVEVSKYTGSLNYGIPLPSIGDDKLSWDFAMRYDGSGNKPDQLHGQLGQGWSLQGVGTITRTVRGNPDINLNYYNASKAWFNNPISYTDQIKENKFLDSLARGSIETQPDVYHFNFGSFSGKFYITPNKTIFFEDDNNLVITPTFQNGGFSTVNGDILSFSITDASGYIYNFEFAERTYIAFEPLPTYSPTYTNFEYNSAWYLKEVIHPNGASVAKLSFTYDQVSSDYTPLINQYQYTSMTYPISVYTDCGFPSLCGNLTTPTYSYANYTGTYIKFRKAIKDVSFSKGVNLIEKMTFFNSANTCTGNYGNYKLDRIELKKGPITSTKLDYKGVFSYDCSINRLSLKSYQETSSGAAVKEPYSFTYNTLTLPTPGTRDQDYWGYYNSNGGSGMVPNYYDNCSSTPLHLGNGNRNPDETRMKAGILTKITYPTKGYTEIDYEAHRVTPFDGCGGADKIIGGLRVKELRNFTKIGSQASKIQYKYTNQNSSLSSGLLIHKLQFGTTTTNEHWGIACLAPCCEIASTYTCQYRTLSTNPLMTPGAVDGSHVGYSRVEEINAGLTVNFFRNEYFSTTVSSKFHSNGDIIKKEVFDDANNLLQQTDYTYWVDGATGSLPLMYSLKAEAKQIQSNKTLLCQTGTSSFEWRLQCCNAGTGTAGCLTSATFESRLERNWLPIKRRKKYVTKEVMTYNSLPYSVSQQSLIKQVDYKYDDLNIFLPTEIKNSDGSNLELSKIINKYATSSNTSVPAAMVAKRMFSDPYESQYYIKGNLTYSTKKDFNPTLPYTPYVFYEKFGNGSYLVKETINSSDSYSNYTSSTKLNDERNSYVWSGDGSRITAVVQNAEVRESAFSSFDAAAAYQGGWLNVNSTDIKNVANGGASGNGYLNPTAATSLSLLTIPVGKYILSYYTKGTGTITPSSTGVSILRTTNSAAMSNTWKYVEHVLNKTTTGTYTLSIGANAFVDELRIYPADALMKTVSYETERNIPVSYGAVDGTVNRIEYDDLKRLATVRNSNDEIIQTYQYYYQNGTDLYNAIVSRLIQKPAVLTATAAYALSGADVQRKLDYYDGIGRNDQSVGIDLSPTSLEQIVHYKYDIYGRKSKDYLPYTIASTGTTVNNSYRSSPDTEQSSFYSSEGTFAFSESILETSPLSRFKGLSHPGLYYKAYPTNTSYQFNTTSEVRQPTTASLFYAANTLFKTIETDEDGKVKTHFTDLLGRKVMQNLGGLRTYYLYDNIGNITQIIQPVGSAILHSTPATINTAANILAQSFVYTYDTKSRLSTKKVPGANGLYTYQYDRLDRLVLIKDPKLFQTFTKYDILSRPIMTGRYSGSATPASEALFENKSTVGHFFTSSLSFPTTGTEVHNVTYYDDYDFDVNYVDNVTYVVPSALGVNFPVISYNGVRGKVTGSKTAVLNTTAAPPTIFTSEYIFYDRLSRPIYTKMDHPYGGSDQSWTQYHFSGWPLRTRLQHTATIGGLAKSTIINERMTYDHAGRRLASYHQIGDSGIENRINLISYNERNEVSRKNLATNQDIDYSYNIRGWLTSINNTYESPCNTNDLFSLGLKYGEPPISELSAVPYYNGNISSIRWTVGASCLVGGVARNKSAYGFQYDSANRLTSAKYGEYTTSNVSIPGNIDRYTVDNINYDNNGNITTLRRKGNITGSTFDFIDNLSYTYNSAIPSQLSTITEASSITKGFQKISAGATGYTYDNNGNVNADGYRGITGTTYNYMNLPAQFTYNASKNIEYTYDASGRKWKVKTTDGATITEKYYFGSIEYNGTNLESIYHEDGRAIPVGPSFEYQYAIKDHLGNNRVMFKMVGATPTIIQEAHYYPFGMQHDGAFIASTDQYRYNGKELQTSFNLGLYDYGARFYDPAIGRWGQVDPHAENYVSNSPYHFSGNNPIKNVDIDGKDYGLVFDHENKTITITGNFNGFSEKNKKAAQIGVDFWNSQSGNFSYKVGKGDDAVYYNINFELTTDKGDDEAQNNVSALPGDMSIFTRTDEDGNKVERGGISDGKSFTVQDKFAEDEKVISHEMGHNLGAGHSNGLMSETTNSQTKKVTRSIVSDILYNSTGGQENSQLGKGKGERTANAAVKYLKQIGTKPENFNNGKIKKN